MSWSKNVTSMITRVKISYVPRLRGKAKGGLYATNNIEKDQYILQILY